MKELLPKLALTGVLVVIVSVLTLIIFYQLAPAVVTSSKTFGLFAEGAMVFDMLLVLCSFVCVILSVWLS